MSDILKHISEIVGKESINFFLFTPNSYIDGHKPGELLHSDPARVLQLAQAFAHPADVF